MGLLLSLPRKVALDILTQYVPERQPTEKDEDELGEAVVAGGDSVERLASVAKSPTREAAEALGASAMQQEQHQELSCAGDHGAQPPVLSLPQVDTDDAVRIWCNVSQPSKLAHGVPSAWMTADDERSTTVSDDTGDAEDEDDEEDEEDEEYEDEETSSSETSTSTSSSFESSIPSGMLRRWKRMRERYADNPDVIGDMYVYRVLTYMGHPHWRKMDTRSCPAAGDSADQSTSLRATMALRLEELRQKRHQLKAAERALKNCGDPASQAVLQGQRLAVRQLEKQLMSLRVESSKNAESVMPLSPKEEQPTAAEDAATAKQDS